MADFRLCSCSTELTEHSFVVDNETLDDGYLCLKCGDFKPCDSDEEYDDGWGDEEDDEEDE